MNEKKDLSDNVEQLKDFSSAAYIEKGGYAQLVRKTIYFISLMITLFIIWAIFTEVNEVAVSYGEIVPVDEVHVVQHVQGGTVQKVYVKNGQEISAGQPLIKLDPESVYSELQKTLSQELSLMLNVVRLQAFINKTPLDKVDWQAVVKNHPYNTPENHLQIERAIQEDKDLLGQQIQERDNQYRIYQEKISQKQSELKQYTETKIEVEKRLDLHEKEEKMFESVVGKGYVSQRDYLAAKRKTIEALSQLKQINGGIESAKSALEEAREELIKIDTVLNKKALEELNSTGFDLLGVRHTIQRLTGLKNRLVITAPITGIVKGLTVSPGSVISPAQGILDLVPSRGTMIAECRLSTKDIGHVSVGEEAHVKVTAFEFTRYGSIEGRVSEISASTFTNEKGLPYYKAKIILSKNYVGDDPRMNILKPGMTVQVDIITGKKTVMAYLTKPITRGLKTAFRER